MTYDCRESEDDFGQTKHARGRKETPENRRIAAEKAADQERKIYEEELHRVTESLNRLDGVDPEEVESEEYQALLDRQEELRKWFGR
jgi:Asp-tRNA(Asn)/Glu-tRNA(Gln) amidotransferase C subunit